MTLQWRKKTSALFSCRISCLSCNEPLIWTDDLWHTKCPLISYYMSRNLILVLKIDWVPIRTVGDAWAPRFLFTMETQLVLLFLEFKQSMLSLFNLICIILIFVLRFELDKLLSPNLKVWVDSFSIHFRLHCSH